jgi:hypothetical protein
LVPCGQGINRVLRFAGTKQLVLDFGVIADLFGARMGCFLFQLLASGNRAVLLEILWAG